jgi:hypothetical protein
MNRLGEIPLHHTIIQITESDTIEAYQDEDNREHEMVIGIIVQRLNGMGAVASTRDLSRMNKVG